MLIAVTGGCGYIGSILLPKLGCVSKRVDCLDIQSPNPTLSASLDSRFRFLCTDISKPTGLKTLQQYDLVIHLAGLVGYPSCNNNPELAHHYNVRGTENILKFKRSTSPVLLASTISNYGLQTCQVDETTELRPTSIYGETKKQAEELIRREPHNVIYRFAGAFGVSPCMRHDLLIHDFVSKAVSGVPTSIYESHFIRHFIHVSDIADAIVFAVKNWKHFQGNIFNVGNPAIELTKRQIVDKIAALKPFPHSFEDSGFDLEKRNYPISFKKLASTGFRAAKTLDTGIRELLVFYEAQGVHGHAA